MYRNVCQQFPFTILSSHVLFVFLLSLFRQKLEQDDDDQYLDSAWSDSRSLKRQVHGLENVKFKFTK